MNLPLFPLLQDYSAYGIDGLSGVDTDALAKLSTAYKFIVLVIPATVLALISMFGKGETGSNQGII